MLLRIIGRTVAIACGSDGVQMTARTVGVTSLRAGGEATIDITGITLLILGLR